MPEDIWQCLPESDDDLTSITQAYYNTEHLLPVVGSQAAIYALPIMFNNSRVGVIHPGYAEYAHAWERSGHQVKLIILPK